jgi:hypothetical protein
VVIFAVEKEDTLPISRRFTSLMFVALCTIYCTQCTRVMPAAWAQSAPSAGAMTDALNAVQPTLANVDTALAGVEVRKWRAPGDVKETTASDIQSIQKDINGTLPALVSQSQAAPSAIGPAFAVFRNIDALYDVLLRVTETATLAGSQQEATRLEQVRSDLQTRRSQLGNALLASATAQDASVVQLRTSLDTASRAMAAQQSTAAAKKVVVNDGPDAATKTVHKRKPRTPTPAPSAAATTASPQQ